MTRRAIAGEQGQATIEVLALVPLALAVTLTAAAILAVQSAREHAGEAAHAGAMALLQDEDARTAARDALPAAERTDATIRVARGRVTVTLPSAGLVRRLIPGLTTTATADAGPEPKP